MVPLGTSPSSVPLTLPSPSAKPPLQITAFNLFHCFCRPMAAYHMKRVVLIPNLFQQAIFGKNINSLAVFLDFNTRSTIHLGKLLYFPGLSFLTYNLITLLWGLSADDVPGAENRAWHIGIALFWLAVSIFHSGFNP